MSRTVTAIYPSRSEAEFARIRLVSAVKVESAQVLARETVAALDSLQVDEKELQSCREALQAGDHVLIAAVARGETESRILDALTVPGDIEREEGDPRLSYNIGSVDAGARAPGRVGRQAPPGTPTAGDEAPLSGIVTAARETEKSRPRAPAAAAAEVKQSARAVDEVQTPAAPKATPEIRLGQPRTAQRGTGQIGNMADDGAGFESRAPARRLSQEEVEAGGLLKNRVIEVVEMREEPVISKEVVVREEVVIRKWVNERVETVEDTVRRTEVEVEELP